MTTYSLEKLNQLWLQEELTNEQRWPFRRGHLLQHIELLTAQVQALQKEVRALQKERQA